MSVNFISSMQIVNSVKLCKTNFLNTTLIQLLNKIISRIPQRFNAKDKE